MHALLYLFRLTAVLLLFAASPPALAVDTPATADPATAALTVKAIKNKIAEVEADSTLDEATRTRLSDLYKKVLANREKTSFRNTTTEAYLKARETAAAEARAIRDELAKAQETKPAVSLDVSESTPIAEVDQQLLIEKANQAAVETKLPNWKNSWPAKRNGRTWHANGLPILPSARKNWHQKASCRRRPTSCPR